jgi:hypothetical protein
VLTLVLKVNLIVGDVFKSKSSSLVGVLKDVDDVVKWFTAHSRALGILRQAQADRHASENAAAVQRGEEPKRRELLTLIYACLTRWTSHYLACSRLVDLEADFKSIAWSKAEELKTLAGKKKEAKARAREILRIIQQPSFWDQVRVCVVSPAILQSYDTEEEQGT